MFGIVHCVSRRFLSRIALLLIVASSVLVADTSIFGPQTFSSTNRVLLAQRSFNASGGDGFLLRIRNANVTIGLVVLNEQIVVRPVDLGAAFSLRSGETWRSVWDRLNRDKDSIRGTPIPLVEKPVRLRQGANSVTVAFIAPRGASLTIEIVRAGTLDTTPPVISSVVNPQPNANDWNRTPVTVTFTCTDFESGIETCPTPIALSGEGANQVVSSTAVDNAGNQATTTVTLNIDLTPPTISVSTTPSSNANGWNRTPVSAHFTCADAGSGIASCPADSTLSSDGVETVRGTAVDSAGNVAEASVEVRIDQVRPTVMIATPSPGTTVTTESVMVSGTFEDAGSGTSVVTCNNSPATITGAEFQCDVPLAVGPNNITISAADRAGNLAQPVVVDVTRTSTSTPSRLLSLRASPPTLEDQTPTIVTVTAGTAPTVGALTLELVQLDEFGAEVANHGPMFDDGSHGDWQGGDGTYTLEVTLSDRGPKQLDFRVAIRVDGAPVPDSENPGRLVIPVETNESVETARADLAAALASGSLEAAYARLGRAYNAVRELDDTPPAILNAIANALRSCPMSASSGLFSLCVGTAALPSGPAEFRFFFARDAFGRWRVITW